jgi:hypothetical protein
MWRTLVFAVVSLAVLAIVGCNAVKPNIGISPDGTAHITLDVDLGELLSAN